MRQVKSFVMFQTFAGVEHGMVFHSARDNMPSSWCVGARQTQDRQIAGFRAPARENDLMGLGAEQGGQPLA